MPKFYRLRAPFILAQSAVVGQVSNLPVIVIRRPEKKTTEDTDGTENSLTNSKPRPSGSSIAWRPLPNPRLNFNERTDLCPHPAEYPQSFGGQFPYFLPDWPMDRVVIDAFTIRVLRGIHHTLDPVQNPSLFFGQICRGIFERDPACMLEIFLQIARRAPGAVDARLFVRRQGQDR